MMPVVLDSRKELAAGLQARTTPEAFVLDGEGMVRYRGRIDNAYSARLKRNPIITTHDLTDAVAAVVAGKPVAKAVTTPSAAIDLEPAAPAKAGAVTFYKDVPRSCTQLRRLPPPGRGRAVRADDFKQASRWAEDIKEYTGNRQMPPWMPPAAWR